MLTSITGPFRYARPERTLLLSLTLGNVCHTFRLWYVLCVTVRNFLRRAHGADFIQA
jgi:hypothetical protein